MRASGKKIWQAEFDSKYKRLYQEIINLDTKKHDFEKQLDNKIIVLIGFKCLNKFKVRQRIEEGFLSGLIDGIMGDIDQQEDVGLFSNLIRALSCCSSNIDKQLALQFIDIDKQLIEEEGKHKNNLNVLKNLKALGCNIESDGSSLIERFGKLKLEDDIFSYNITNIKRAIQ